MPCLNCWSRVLVLGSRPHGEGSSHVHWHCIHWWSAGRLMHHGTTWVCVAHSDVTAPRCNRSVNTLVEGIAKEGDAAMAATIRACEYLILENDVWTTDLLMMGCHSMLCRAINSDGTISPNILVGVKDVTEDRHLAATLADNCFEVSGSSCCKQTIAIVDHDCPAGAFRRCWERSPTCPWTR